MFMSLSFQRLDDQVRDGPHALGVRVVGDESAEEARWAEGEAVGPRLRRSDGVVAARGRRGDEFGARGGRGLREGSRESFGHQRDAGKLLFVQRYVEPRATARSDERQ